MSAAPRGVENTSPSKFRILIVDDNKAIRTIIRTFLIGEPFEIFEAENGRDALKIIPEATPDIIVSDLTMPVMGGIEFLEQLRKNDVRAERTGKPVPVIVLTSLKEQARCREAGASGFLQKPIKSEDFLSAVQRQLRKA